MKKLINIMLAALIALALPCTANGINAEQQQRKTTAAKKMKPLLLAWRRLLIGNYR